MSECKFELAGIPKKAIIKFLEETNGKTTLTDVFEAFCKSCKSYESAEKCGECIIARSKHSPFIREGIELIQQMLSLPTDELQRRVSMLKQEQVKWEVKQMEAKGYEGVIIKRLLVLLTFLNLEYDYGRNLDNIVEEFDDIYESLFYDKKEPLEKVATAKGILIEDYNLHEDFYHRVIMPSDSLEEQFKDYMDYDWMKEEIAEGKKDSNAKSSLLYWDFVEGKAYIVTFKYEDETFTQEEWTKKSATRF